MTSSFSEQFTGPYATPELVGRKNIIDRFENILDEKSISPKLVFLSGPGGIGKTRLLKQAREIADKKPNCRAAGDVLDFYHIMLHAPIGLANAIFELLTPPFDCFQPYQAAYQTFNRAVLSGNMVELEKLRDDAVNKFDQDLKQLSTSKRIILFLDTAERVVYGLSGWTDEIPFAEAWSWLIEKIPDWKNVIVFVAGREETRPAIEKLAIDHPGLVEEIEVGLFSLDESLKYFEAVAKLSSDNGDIHFSERLKNLPQDFKQGAHTYSQGRPIILSLLVDYLSFPGRNEIPEMLRKSTVVTNEEDYQLFEEGLFDRLRQGEFGETLIALGRVPKGADEELLSSLLNISRSEAQKRLTGVKSLSVVKIRPEDQRFFLHDEMYALLQRHVYDSPYDLDAQKKAFEAIKDYYHNKRELITQHLNELYAPVEEKGAQSLDMKDLGKTQARYQALLSENMYYFLRHDLGRGFRAYYRYSHEAIMARDILMDLQLQAELLSYLSRPPAPISEKDISVKLILANLKVSPLARAWALGKNETGLKNAHDFLNNVEVEWKAIFPDLVSAVHVWAATLHIMRGAKDDLIEANSHLKACYSLLPKDVATCQFSNSNLDTKLWFAKAIYALARRTNGYLKRVQGFMRDAVNEYQQAAVVLREIDLRIEMATTKNDMGFAQAELGEWHDGRANVLDALHLRRELGPRVPVALSLNTLASIDVREGQNASGRQNAERALAIFRVFSQKRGIAMALTTLSESLRRLAGTLPLISEEDRIKLLREARDLAREANSHFSDLGETSRQVEALIELGCACRDWVLRLKASPRPSDDPERIFKESENSLTQASDLAKRIGLIYRHVDALVNMVWLRFYMLDSDNPLSKVNELDILIEKTENAFPSEADIEKQPQVWAQKGKLYVLKGHLEYWKFVNFRQKEPKGISIGATEILNMITENYTHALIYSSRFSSDFQGIRQTKDGIFDRLKILNADEMRIICNKIKSLYPDGSVIQTLLTNRALWHTV